MISMHLAKLQQAILNECLASYSLTMKNPVQGNAPEFRDRMGIP